MKKPEEASLSRITNYNTRSNNRNLQTIPCPTNIWFRQCCSEHN